MNSGAHGPGESGYPGARAEGHARPALGLADSWFALEGQFRLSAKLHVLVAPNHAENESNTGKCAVKMLPRRRTVLGRAEGDDSLLCR